MSKPSPEFYTTLFHSLDLTPLPDCRNIKVKSFSRHALLRAFVVMHFEGLPTIAGLLTFLNEHRDIAQCCGFDPSQPLPSRSTFDSFLRKADESVFLEILKMQAHTLDERKIAPVTAANVEPLPILDIIFFIAVLSVAVAASE